MKRLEEDRGQAAALAVVLLAALLGFGVLVVDVGSWFHARRTTQAAADAAALAGAQALPQDPAGATDLAVQYAQQNGIPIASGDVSVASALTPNDTITVHVRRSVPGYFGKLFGLSSVAVGATASARSATVDAVTHAAPIVVSAAHPLLSGSGCPCFGTPTSLTLGPAGAPGAFDLVDFESSGGTTGSSTLASWISSGYDGELAIGSYPSDAGTKWNSSAIQQALAARVGSDLIFPVYDGLAGNGSCALYHVVGWASFHLTGVTARGSDGSLDGFFDRVTWDGVESRQANPGNDFGVHSIQLVG